MERTVIGFHQDEQGHWAADLDCGHTRHVRHDPPWENRPWVLTPEGRAQFLGSKLNCVRCDEDTRASTAPIIAMLLLTSAFATGVARGQDSNYPPRDQLIPAPSCETVTGVWQTGDAPCASITHEAWLKDIRHWRAERLIRIGYDGSQYDLPALKWTQSSFIQPQTMIQERYLYDPALGKYTVDRYLDDLEQRYGGIDSVLIWPTYPNLGIDDRNQLDMIRSMPGGLSGVKQMIADFHRRGVRVLFPMMMWDQGTRDPGQPWPVAIAEMMKQIDADGVNGDTQEGVPRAFSLAAEKLGHPLAFEPELSPADEALGWNLMTWGQYGQFGFVPGVDRFRWLEPRHMVNISDRWNRNKTDDLQYAFFNGEGWESWENIWGIWNGISKRDAAATRRIATIERSVARFLITPDWEPFYRMHFYGVYASRWPLGDETVWTIVNRNEYDVRGEQMAVSAANRVRYFDLYNGVEIVPRRERDIAILSFPLEAHGFGAILATPGQLDPAVRNEMARLRELTRLPLSSYSSEWVPLQQKLVDIQVVKPAVMTPPGMVKIPGGEYEFKVKGIEIEGEDQAGVDVQYPWENVPRRFHEHRMTVKPFYIDKYPVTNRDFKSFLTVTQYHPADDLNFLRDWKDGMYPAEWENKPVTWVSLEDARAYAAWAGKRLPHEWEWQIAAQGLDARRYPWGNEWNANAVPIPDTSRQVRAPGAVDAHPQGASPFGVMDLVGNVWQWTDEYDDEHTRAAIVRGCSSYQPQGSMWYFPQAYRNDEHGKLLLMAPSYDRSATIGFRCVRDAQ